MLGRHILLVDRRHHQFHPTIARSLIHPEWIVAHAHARMAAIADVVLRAAKAVDQKAAQTFLRTVLQKICETGHHRALLEDVGVIGTERCGTFISDLEATALEATALERQLSLANAL